MTAEKTRDVVGGVNARLMSAHLFLDDAPCKSQGILTTGDFFVSRFSSLPRCTLAETLLPRSLRRPRPTENPHGEDPSGQVPFFLNTLSPRPTIVLYLF